MQGDSLLEFRKWPSRKLLYAIAAIVVAELAACRVLWHFVPRGGEVIPYLFFSIEKGKFRSPDGINEVAVVYNDAGAMHSGNHWTWIVVENRWTGKRVVKAGYSTPDIMGRKLQIEWVDDDSFWVPFAKGRYEHEGRRVLVTLE